MNEDDPNTTEEPNTVSRLCRTGTDRSRLTVPEPIPLPSLPYQERTEWSASLTPVEISAFTAAHIADPTFIVSMETADVFSHLFSQEVLHWVGTETNSCAK